MARKRSLSKRSFISFPPRNVRAIAILLILIISLALISEAFLASGGSVANAASPDNAHPKSISKKREAWMDASDYSVAHPNVATFAINGHAQNATNQQIVDYVQKRFTENGVTNSIAFTGRTDSLGVSMYFFLNGHAYGPVGFAKMNVTIDEVAGHVRGLQAR